MSKTDGILDIIGWRCDTRPRPQLYIGPSRDFVTEQFEPRLMALFDEAPRLSGLTARGKRNKKFKKYVNGVPIRLAWAGSETSLASDQAGDIYIDEFDKMFVGRKGTGDAFTLGKARADTYADRKICVTSTPKRGRIDVERCPKSGLEFWAVAENEHVESPIWLKWQAGTRHHWAWKCPSCSDWFIPRIRNLRPPHDKATPAETRRGTFMCCPAGCVIDESHKTEMNAGGRFVAPGQTITPDGVVEGDPPDSTTLGLWVSGVASPFLSWGERLEEIMNAQLTGDPEAVQGAVNKVGECYSQVPVGAPTHKVVMERRLPYKLGETPREVIKLVAGIDVQQRELYYTIRGFGSRASSFLVDKGRIYGHTGGNEPWDALADLLLEPIGGLSIELALIDSGFRPNKIEAGDVHRVYDFVRRYPWLCKAAKGRDVRVRPVDVSKHEVKPDGKGAAFSIELAMLDSDFFKSLVMSRLLTDNGRPGSLGMPADLPEEYAKQVVSEARELKKGKPVWRQLSNNNHWLDCEALCAAAGYLLNVQRLPEGLMRDWDDQAPPPLAERRLVPEAAGEAPAAPQIAPAPAAAPAAPKAIVAQKSLRETLAARMATRSRGLNGR